MTLSVARSMLAVMAVTFAASVLANAVVATTWRQDPFPFFVWIHVVIVVLGISALFKIRSLHGTWGEFFLAFSPLPKWIWVVSAIAIATATFRLGEFTSGFELGMLPDGSPVHSKSWAEHDGKYWLTLNKKTTFEITEVQYRELNREAFGFFAMGWLVFSVVVMVQWYYIVRLETTRLSDSSSADGERAE